MNEAFDQRTFELIKALSQRLDLQSDALAVLGEYVKVQAEKIENLESWCRHIVKRLPAETQAVRKSE